MTLSRVCPAVLLVLLAGCSFRNVGCGSPLPPAEPPAAFGGGDAAPGAAAAVRVAFLGDSLTAGLGLLSQQSFPARIEELFAAEGYEVEAVNAGVSGDTSAGGLRRVDQLLDGSIRVLVIALGANDALRGLTVQQTRENLARIIDAALARQVSVLLCGMEGPTNLGTDYRDAFRELFVDLLRQYQGRIAFVPFLLEGVAGDPTLNQSDGVHPNEQGAALIAKTVYPKVRELVDRLGGGD